MLEGSDPEKFKAATELFQRGLRSGGIDYIVLSRLD